VIVTTELQQGYLDLYRLAVGMADRVSAQRATANGFFLTMRTGLAALLSGAQLRWYVGETGQAGSSRKSASVV
jgi:hypothetical protein